MRVAKAQQCRQCKASTWVGLDGDQMALWVVADYAPITAAGELQARLAGRATFTLKLIKPLKLERRDRWAITSRPAGGHLGRTRYVVMTEHRCMTQMDRDDAGLVSLIMMLNPASSGVMQQGCPY